MKNKLKIIIPILAILLVITIKTTTAYYRSDYVQTFNLFSSKYDVEIVQDADPSWGKRIITFKNNGTSGVYLRISYNEIWSKVVDDTEVTYNNLLNNDSIVIKEWTDEFLNNFTLIDGWYYYNKVLEASSEVTVLKSIRLQDYDSSWDYDYRDLDYELAWNYETVQVKNNAVEKLWNISPVEKENGIKWD